MTEYQMTQEEMDILLDINKQFALEIQLEQIGVTYYCNGWNREEEIRKQWQVMANKYHFDPMTVEPCSKGGLYFQAKSTKMSTDNYPNDRRFRAEGTEHLYNLIE